MQNTQKIFHQNQYTNEKYAYAKLFNIITHPESAN